MPTPKRCPQNTRSPKPRRSVLRFTPTAWSKLLFLRDRGETEIGGFGISAAEELLRIEDVMLVPQQASIASVAFDDAAVADFFDRQIDQGRRPEQFARIWIHTHPGHDPSPSPVDEATFARVFGRCDWALMVILARGGAAYVRLQWHVGPRGRQRLPVEVDLRHPFAGSDQPAWEAEYDRCVAAVRPSAGFWPDDWPVAAADADASRFSLLERDPSAP